MIKKLLIPAVFSVAGFFALKTYAENCDGQSTCCNKSVPQASITDWIRGHEGTPLRRHDFDNNIALYVGENVDRNAIDWVLPFASSAFEYMKNTYDPAVRYGPDRLFVFLHQGVFGGGTISSYFDAFSGFRNAVDAGSNSWVRRFGDINIDILSHEMAHIVEGSSNGIHESPAFTVWRDSKWAEIFQYDLYVALGMQDEANRVYDKFMAQSDNFPRANTFWFRDWFYPIWHDYGRGAVLSGFFKQLSLHFPTRLENDGRNPIYTRRMNFGEFVHFWSGAAGVDLSQQAERAFGNGFAAELEQARRDFPNVYYPR